MRWRLLLEEFGPKLTHVKGANDIVADALSRLEIAEEELSAEAFANELANEEEDFPTGYPLSYKDALRSRTLSQIARASLLQRTTRFTFLNRCNTSVPNGIT